MIAALEIGLANAADATLIAELSRDAIEHDLVWSWTPTRVRRAMSNPEINVAVARHAAGLVGFAILQYHDDDAHLALLAVRAEQRRRGVARALMNWLDVTLQIAGISAVKVDVREGNGPARAFYRALGFTEERRTLGYYQQRENAIHLLKSLR